MKPLILAALLVITGNAKDRHWETGKVIDTEITTTYGGQTGANGNTSPINIVTQTVVIAGDDYAGPLGQYYHEYTAQRILKWRWSKSAVLIVNTPVKFAVEKRKLSLVDDNGKQYELSIVKQVQKEAK